MNILVDTGSWRIYPPLSAWGTWIENRVQSPPMHKLPREFTNLTKLESLVLWDLNLVELPNDFSELKNLKYLDLSFNKLTVVNELDKLARLPNLKELTIIGNKIDTAIVNAWNKSHSHIKINNWLTY